MIRSAHRLESARGMTLVELLVTMSILGVVLMVVTGIMLSTSRVEGRTVRRAEVQASSRQALALMTTELRQAGADPSSPPVGITAVVSADSHLVRVRADLNGDGTIQTAEPSEDVTYHFVDTTGVVTRDPGAGPATVLANVRDLQFAYFDAAGQPITPLPLSPANAARVAAIGLTVTTENRDSAPMTLSTRITLRNR
ncbi:MAG: prepilin-type N-terminal cleavage/methylation domain-containing protein [Candidatus Eisenbacteria bacterium]|nr:prepilin-type N-terminal cleavage/methylation domain-containing protein [Candidatus Eisenbacteria bacterium]